MADTNIVYSAVSAVVTGPASQADRATTSSSSRSVHPVALSARVEALTDVIVRANGNTVEAASGTIKSVANMVRNTAITVWRLEIGAALVAGRSSQAMLTGAHRCCGSRQQLTCTKTITGDVIAWTQECRAVGSSEPWIANTLSNGCSVSKRCCQTGSMVGAAWSAGTLH